MPPFIRRIVDLGDGWIPIMGSTGEDVRSASSELRDPTAACEELAGAFRAAPGADPRRVDC